MHLLNTRICRYTYLTSAVIYCDQDRYVMTLFSLIKVDSTVIKSGVFLTKFGHDFLFSLSAQSDYVWKLLERSAICIKVSSDPITF